MIRLSLLLSLISLAVLAADPPPPPAPTYKDVHYGPLERQVLDFWQAKTEGPAPVLVMIHGGGWLHGDKDQQGARSGREIERLLKEGISVACISYRLTTTDPLPAPILDAARALQYIRYKAAEWNVDKVHIAVTGGSAGGCTSLWLAAHDDIADPKAEDPVLRESSRVCGAVVHSAQSTVEPKVIREQVTPVAVQHAMICRAGGFKSNQEMDANYASKAELYHEYSALNFVSKDDPPVLLYYSGNLDTDKDGIHHSRFGTIYLAKAKEVGAPCWLSMRKKNEGYPPVTFGAPDFYRYVLKGTPLPTPAK